MQRLPEPPDLLNKESFTLWLVICLSVLPMTLPVFAAFSNNPSALAVEVSQLTFDEEGASARPLKAEVVDNGGVSSAGLDTSGGFTDSAPDVMLALFAVLNIAFLGWRFTLRHQTRQ